LTQMSLSRFASTCVANLDDAFELDREVRAFAVECAKKC